MRNSTVKKATESLERTEKKSVAEIIVAGRIVGVLDDGFVLQDESGRIDVVYPGEVHAGDIVEVSLSSREEVGDNGVARVLFSAVSVSVLVTCAADFFIRGSDPNYRKMVVDTALREKFVQRQMLTQKIRDFFHSRGFIEAETPLMVRHADVELNIDPFRTSLVRIPEGGGPAAVREFFLITSPEYALKKLITGGMEKIFQISHCFRNNEDDNDLHNPEFTMLEWYRAFSDYREIMKDTEELGLFLARAANGKNEVIFGDYKVDLSTPWERVKVKDLFERYADIDEETLLDGQKLREEARKRGYGIGEDAPYIDSFYIIMLNEIEPKIGLLKPVIVYDYPAQMSALAKKSEADPRYAERFEVYAGGMELCNAYSELNDAVEQEQRLKSKNGLRKDAGKEQYEVDQSFIDALKFGMPPSGGNALGVDRLIMLVTNTADIRDMILFPLRDLQ